MHIPIPGECPPGSCSPRDQADTCRFLTHPLTQKESIAYHEYKVIADRVIVQCKVLRGFVYPTFSSKGNVVQYLHPATIEEEIYLGKIEEDFIWLKKKKISV